MLKRNMSWIYLCSTSNIKLGFIAYINYISYKTMVLCSVFKIHFHFIVAQCFLFVCSYMLWKSQEERIWVPLTFLIWDLLILHCAVKFNFKILLHMLPQLILSLEKNSILTSYFIAECFIDSDGIICGCQDKAIL